MVKALFSGLSIDGVKLAVISMVPAIADRLPASSSEAATILFINIIMASLLYWSSGTALR
ncbi:hypothetical protein [Erwinia mallotivora]|uniref:hypothetical protein n=1 Tax=Erwinia mallotivora TaxID=69222 RepID=UPI0021C13A58|nr:hypothetical protein [Erwinia mallotivora]